MTKDEYNALRVGDIVYLDFSDNPEQVVTRLSDDKVYSTPAGERGALTYINPYEAVAIHTPAIAKPDRDEVLEKFRAELDSMTQEELEKEWKELKHLNEIGPTVSEYFDAMSRPAENEEHFIAPYESEAKFRSAMALHGPWLVKKTGNDCFLPFELSLCRSVKRPDGSRWISFEELARDWGWQDGTPCGVIVRKSDGKPVFEDPERPVFESPAPKITRLTR